MPHLTAVEGSQPSWRTPYHRLVRVAGCIPRRDRQLVVSGTDFGVDAVSPATASGFGVPEGVRSEPWPVISQESLRSSVRFNSNSSGVTRPRSRSRVRSSIWVAMLGVRAAGVARPEQTMAQMMKLAKSTNTPTMMIAQYQCQCALILGRFPSVHCSFQNRQPGRSAVRPGLRR